MTDKVDYVAVDNEEKIDLVKAFMDSIARMDFDAAGTFFSEDVVADFPYSPTPKRMQAVRGRAALVAHLKKVVPLLIKKIEFFYDAFYPGADPELLIIEFHSTGELAGNRGPYANEYISVFRFKDGKIVYWKEFFDAWRVSQKISS